MYTTLLDINHNIQTKRDSCPNTPCSLGAVVYIARRRARRRRARWHGRRTAPAALPGSALPCPETQPVVLSPKIVVRGTPQAASPVASTFILGAGEGKATLGAWV